MSDTLAVATVKVDNARVRVTEYRFAPGARTGHHRHEHDYVIVPLTTGSLTVTGEAGETTNAMRAGEPYYRDAGAEHDVRNASPFEFAFIEIELKDERRARPAKPRSRPRRAAPKRGSRGGGRSRRSGR